MAARFGLRDAFYAMALIGASVSLFEWLGVFIGLVVLWGWVQVLVRQERRSLTLVELLVVIALLGIFLGLLLPSVSSVSRRSELSHLRRVAMALELYREQHGSLPWRAASDSKGAPAPSWRVMILPQLGYSSLYGQYRFDEPWNSRHNARLLQQKPAEYAGAAPWDDPSLTVCHAVAGQDVERGAQEWAAIVNCDERPTPWTAPGDLAFDEAIALLSAPPRYPEGRWRRGFFSSTYYGRTAVNGAGDVGRIGKGARDEDLRRWLTTPAGPEGIVGWIPNKPPPGQETWRQPHYGNWLRLGVFLGLVIWPVTSVLRRRRRISLQPAGAEAPRNWYHQRAPLGSVLGEAAAKPTGD